MPTTRSESKKQISLDDFKNDDEIKSRSKAKKGTSTSATTEGSEPQSSKKSNQQDKRKSPKDHDTESPPPKKLKTDPEGDKQAHSSNDNTTDLEKPIMINRSPVLQLWAATVASFLHPDESWDTCLSIGGSIASLCAISKGRAIGKVEPKDSSADAANKDKKRKKENAEDSRELDVMGFPMHIKNNVVMENGKPKSLKEGTLHSKVGGDENFNRAKEAMEDALETWSDDKDELDKKAFHMYEKFRPNVASGQSGWGRKGELHLHKIKSAVVR